MPTSQTTRHGAVATGLAKAKGSSMGPGGNFVGTKNPQDIKRSVSSTQVGNDSGPKGSNDGNSGVPAGRTGGMKKKSAGKVGFQKAMGSC